MLTTEDMEQLTGGEVAAILIAATALLALITQANMRLTLDSTDQYEALAGFRDTVADVAIERMNRHEY